MREFGHLYFGVDNVWLLIYIWVKNYNINVM